MIKYLLPILVLVTTISASTQAVDLQKEVFELIDMLKFVVKVSATISVILIVLLGYFIYSYMKLKKYSEFKLEELKKEIEEAEINCNITGLKNKKYFDDLYNIETRISLREKNHLNLFILEIVDFDKHFSKDKESQQILKNISTILKQYFRRGTDSIFFLKDGMFIGISLTARNTEAREYLEKLLTEMNNLNIDNLNIAIGLKTNHFIEEKLSKDTIYNMAYHALIKAKEIGSNTIIEFDDTLIKS